MKKEIKVEDMMCEHCVRKITQVLESEGIDSTIDLSSKQVTVDEQDLEDALELIKNAGFNPVM